MDMNHRCQATNFGKERPDPPPPEFRTVGFEMRRAMIVAATGG